MPDSPLEFPRVPRSLIGEIPPRLHQASAERRQEACKRWSETEGAILIGYSGQRPFPESSPLREAHRRSCRCIFPKNQYSAQTCLPSAQNGASSEGAAIVDPLRITNATRAMDRVTVPPADSASRAEAMPKALGDLSPRTFFASVHVTNDASQTN